MKSKLGLIILILGLGLSSLVRADGLSQRVAQLETLVATLEDRIAQLEANSGGCSRHIMDIVLEPDSEGDVIVEWGTPWQIYRFHYARVYSDLITLEDPPIVQIQYLGVNAPFTPETAFDVSPSSNEIMSNLLFVREGELLVLFKEEIYDPGDPVPAVNKLLIGAASDGLIHVKATLVK
ncbi:MAG TPA: hypothetical protein PK176_11555 [Acidobacteriota bacterium]|nr:hypothetical protein [Acidobacteriota bacterium]HQM63940.1 hypothetical protein [Acidobacteriota bacterium]